MGLRFDKEARWDAFALTLASTQAAILSMMGTSLLLPPSGFGGGDSGPALSAALEVLQ